MSRTWEDYIVSDVEAHTVPDVGRALHQRHYIVGVLVREAAEARDNVGIVGHVCRSQAGVRGVVLKGAGGACVYAARTRHRGRGGQGCQCWERRVPKLFATRFAHLPFGREAPQNQNTREVDGAPCNQRL
jgi:hypothetical protein